MKECVLTWGDLASWVKAQRSGRSEKSAEVVVAAVRGPQGRMETAKDRTRASDRGRAKLKGHASDAGATQAGGSNAGGSPAESHQRRSRRYVARTPGHRNV